MPGPEHLRAPGEAPAERPGSYERLVQHLGALEAVAGKAFPPLPEAYTEKDINDAERSLTSDHIVESFSEAYRVNELQQRRNALQHTAALRNADNPSHEDVADLIALNQATTYYEYIPSIVHDTVDVLHAYQAVRAAIPAVTEQLQHKEEQAALYVRALHDAIAERTAYATVLLANGHLSTHQGDTQQLMAVREQYLQSAALSAESKDALLRGNTAVQGQRGNALNQRIIDILSGAAAVPGVEPGFYPALLYTQILAERYEQDLAAEKRAVRDPALLRTRARHDELARKNHAAAQQEGLPLTTEEVAEYEQLRALLADRQAFMKQRAVERKETMQSILQATDRLATQHMKRSELSTIQHQFGDMFDVEGASAPNPAHIPENVREKMSQHMEQRSQFHIQRFDAFLEKVESNVIRSGVQEWAEDITNKHGREALRRANHALSSVITAILPDTFGIRGHVHEQLTQPLDEALGWPPGKDEWEELTAEEQQIVLEKSQSVLDAIRSFDRMRIERFRSTLGIIQGMPEASAFADQDVRNPLPPERVTSETRDQLITTYGGATVYSMLFRQMDEDWDGFMGEYKTFLTTVNATVDVHIEVGEELHRLGNAYNDLKWYLLYAAALGLGIGVLGSMGLSALARPAARLAWKAAKKGGRLTARALKETGRITRSTVRGLSTLRGNLRSPPGAATTTERAAKGASRISPKAIRVLGPLGVVLAAVDLKRVMQRDARLQELQQVQGIEAALELLSTHGNKRAERYTDELTYLNRQLEAQLCQEGAQQLLGVLEQRFAAHTNPAASALKARCEALYANARVHREHLHKLFPVIDYLVTDPAHEPGNVGVNIRSIDEARSRGMAYEKEYRSLHGNPYLVQLFKEQPPSADANLSLAPLKSTDAAQKRAVREAWDAAQKQLQEERAARPVDVRSIEDLPLEWQRVQEEAAQLLAGEGE